MHKTGISVAQTTCHQFSPFTVDDKFYQEQKHAKQLSGKRNTESYRNTKAAE